MTLKKLKKEPPFFSFLPAFVESLRPGKGTFGDLGSCVASTGSLPLVGLVPSEGVLCNDGFVDVEKRGVVGAVEGVAREEAEVETVFSESLALDAFVVDLDL